MKPFLRIAAAVALLPLMCLVLSARPTHSESALWIKISEHGKLKATIAVTEEIARLMLESDNANMHFHMKDKEHDLITRRMIESVLDGSESSVTASDPANDTEAEVYMKRLHVPGSKHGSSKLVMETYKEGKRSFRMNLGEFSFETDDEETNTTVETNFSWKSVLPFLAKKGGGVYIQDHDDDTEIWVYVE